MPMVLLILRGSLLLQELLIKKTMELYNRIIDKSLLVRRINVVANHVMREEDVVKEDSYRQLDIFTNYEELERIEKEQNEEFEKERHIQEAAIEIKKNSVRTHFSRA